MRFLFLRYEAGQLKIMCVGGPNVRKDYHIDEGEEVMNYQYINPLSPNIKIQIPICCPYTFPIKVVMRSC